MLATIGPDGSPHVVPIVHVVVGDVITFAIDHKPKTKGRLRRLENISADPRVAVLFDHRSDDWSELWWVRADGVASIHNAPPASARHLHNRHPEYRLASPEGPWVEIEVRRWSGWAWT